MIDLLLIAAVAIGTAVLCRCSPRRLTRIGIAAVAFAFVAIGVAELTGNLLLFYVGAAVAPFGLIVFLFWAVGAASNREGFRPR
jgi:hypothetical protein